jgi:LemA protein
VSSEERIERLERSGRLDGTQAEQLRAAVRRLAERPPPRSPTRMLGRRVGLLAAAIALAVLLALLWGVPAGPPDSVQDVRTALNQPGVTGDMSQPGKLAIGAALVLVPLLIPLLGLVWIYNGLVNREEAVFAGWAQVESNLQRRHDLVPDLVEAVSRYMRHERETLAATTGERARALDPLAQALAEVVARQAELGGEEGAVDLGDQAALERMAAAQARLQASLKQLIGVAEAYPELRAGDQFLALQAQLEGTENRINVARMAFNDAVRSYNSAMRRLPGSLVAGLGSFQRKAYFEAEPAARRDLDVAIEG